MSALTDLISENELERRLHCYKVLETARRSICCYLGDPCDCKYRLGVNENGGSEATGCPELRDLITCLTGFSPYNRRQTVDDDLTLFRAQWAAERAHNQAAAVGGGKTDAHE